MSSMYNSVLFTAIFHFVEQSHTIFLQLSNFSSNNKSLDQSYLRTKYLILSLLTIHGRRLRVSDYVLLRFINSCSILINRKYS